MRLPAALVPLRNGTFRHLWTASVIGWLGTWLQNTGAGWLMTSLAPQPIIVAMVQAATIMPVFLLALPGGALADIVDRRVFLLGTQIWTILAATLLAILTVLHLMTAGWLLALTFAIGIGTALTAPAWSAIVPELVPREDMVQAIALNGIGYNLTRAVGPAIGGFLILLGGSSLAFSMYAVSILAVISALFVWRRERRFTGLPREHFMSAMRAGMRFVRNTSAIQAAMVRTAAYSIPASAPWALLPLYVRRDLMLGPGMYGVILGMMGIGGVTSGMLLPIVRGKVSRGGTVVGCTTLSCARNGRGRRVKPLDSGGVGYAAVRARVDLRVCHDPGGGATGLSTMGSRPRPIDLSTRAKRSADPRISRVGLAWGSNRHSPHFSDRDWCWPGADGARPVLQHRGCCAAVGRYR